MQVPTKTPIGDLRSLSVTQPKHVTFAVTSEYVIFPCYRDTNRKLWNWPRRLFEENLCDVKASIKAGLPIWTSWIQRPKIPRQIAASIIVNWTENPGLAEYLVNNHVSFTRAVSVMADKKKAREKFPKERNAQAQEESSEEEDMDVDVTQEESDKSQESSEEDEEMNMDFDFDQMSVLDQWGQGQRHGSNGKAAKGPAQHEYLVGTSVCSG